MQDSTKPQRPIALLAALELEARALIKHLASSSHRSPELSVWAGVVESTPVVLVVSGVGKVSAALATQFVCDAFQPRSIIAFGLAGAVKNDEARGRVIVASGALQHDLDARPLTDARAMIPSLGLAVIPADPALVQLLRHAAASVVDEGHVRDGLVLTGDRIVTTREDRDRIVANFPDGACFDMETAAVAQVALQNGVPWAALRVTSDAADETFDLEEVIGFGIDAAADLFDQVVRGALRQRSSALT